ncbi:hypothetical protein [Nocardia pseudobrasiliensis]|uniref:Ligand-binding SRPBCC domain-containing protein n=1 Tax=Nocardia pseudobrasiliensis TaxID=45979 RepID=A0A370IAR0_9NOCA|nr:hypothetical protein [Nocardia pseudobrasiliensis]RDI67803.1 ligand-binding SRPBCC domain-containing protein [Nocardia pseudobrasiliensis]
MATQHIRVRSEVDAPLDTVWKSITSAEGINAELRPYVRMLTPRGAYDLDIGNVTDGTRLGHSVLLLFGVVPFDYDDITVAEIEPGRRFREESTMLSMRSWTHERTLREIDGRTEVTDAVSFHTRLPLSLIPGTDRALRATVAFLFRHRHQRLRRVLRSR